MEIRFTTVKYLLFFYNVVFGLSGLAVLGVASFCYSNAAALPYIIEGLNFSAIPHTLLALATVIFFISFYGCFGAIRESYRMTVTFTVLLLVILIAQITACIALFVNAGTLTDASASAVKSLYDDYKNHNETAINVVRGMHYYFECCGLDGPDYWQGMDLPESCSTQRRSIVVIFQDGCLEKVIALINTNSVALCAVTGAIGAIKVIGIVFALSLINSIKNRELQGGF